MVFDRLWYENYVALITIAPWWRLIIDKIMMASKSSIIWENLILYK